MGENNPTRVAGTDGVDIRTIRTLSDGTVVTQLESGFNEVGSVAQGGAGAESWPMKITGLDDDGDGPNTVRVDAEGLAHVHAQIFSSHLHDVDLHMTPLGEATVQATKRLVGPAFTGSTLDTNFWTETVANAGSLVQGGSMLKLQTNTTANGSAQVDSVRRARFLFAHTNKVRFATRTQDAGHADVLRRWGVDDGTDGLGFSLGADPANPTRLGIWCRANGGAIADVTSGFNGENGTTVTWDTDVHALEVVYFTMGLWFFLDGQLLHTIIPTTEPCLGNFTLPIRASITNRNGSTVARVTEIWNASVLRQADVEPQAHYAYLNSNATTVLKRGPTHIQSIVIVGAGAGNNTLSLYDAVSATGTPIVLDTSSAALGELPLHVNFATGLTAVLATGTAARVIVNYD